MRAISIPWPFSTCIRCHASDRTQQPRNVHPVGCASVRECPLSLLDSAGTAITDPFILPYRLVSLPSRLAIAGGYAARRGRAQGGGRHEVYPTTFVMAPVETL
jgi:hypothetical protein